MRGKQAQQQPLDEGDEPASEEEVEAAKQAAAAMVGDAAEMTIPDPSQGALPEWAVLPPDLKIPKGRVMAALLFRAEWTDTPWKGDRQCVVWNLTPNDEQQAYKRSVGDMNRAASELAKQMVRAIDGKRINWMGKSAEEAHPDFWWAEIGAKCRQLLVRWYVRSHVLDEKEQADFFANCVAVRTASS